MSDIYEIEWNTTELDDLATRFPNIVGRIMQDMVLSLQANLIKEAPVDKGRFRKTIEVPRKRADGLWSIRMSIIGKFIQEGTRAHYIFPVAAKVLRFRVGGEVVFAQWVSHPGTSPNKFMDRGLEGAMAASDSIIEKVLSQAV